MVLVFAETAKGNFKKAAFEAVTYGKKVAANYGTTCAAITIGSVNNAGQLGTCGASKIYNIAGNDAFDAQVYAAIIADAAKQLGAKVVITSHTATGKSIAGRVAVRLNAGLVSGANTILSAGGTVSKSVFSGKAIAEYSLTSDVKVISVMGNALAPERTGSDVAVTPLSIAAPASRVKVKAVKTADGIVPLPEAEKVVSAGRGMKDPSNWGIVEELATIIGATTACSRPVADAHWRPHHEHVGQTGVAIRPNLYIAIGISGAIQHLAGVNNSRVIVVINKDPEAPFFKAADYGVVGDLFDIVPRLTEAVKKYKASQN
jgi:electron transfer flavoprotein alpha subunit